MEISSDEYKSQLSVVKEENREIEMNVQDLMKLKKEKLITERFKAFSKSWN